MLAYNQELIHEGVAYRVTTTAEPPRDGRCQLVTTVLRENRPVSRFATSHAIADGPGARAALHALASRQHNGALDTLRGGRDPAAPVESAPSTPMDRETASTPERVTLEYLADALIEPLERSDEVDGRMLEFLVDAMTTTSRHRPPSDSGGKGEFSEPAVTAMTLSPGARSDVADGGPGAVAPIFDGTLATLSVPDLLQFFRLSGRSGRLELDAGGKTGWVLLARGRIAAAGAPRCPQLGRLLLEQEAITEPQLLEALQQQDQQPTALLGAILVNQRTSEQAVRAALERQARCAIAAMVGWTGGRFTFHRAALPRRAVSLALDAQSAVLEALRQHDEDRD